MRYKKNLARFLPIADAAQLIQQNAGISVAAAKEDIVQAIQDYAVPVLFYDVSKGGRRAIDSNNPVHSVIVKCLNPDVIGWDNSFLSLPGNLHRSSIEVEIEVSRYQILTLWRTPDTDPETKQATEPLTEDRYRQLVAWFVGPYRAEHRADNPHPTRLTSYEAAKRQFPDWQIKRDTVWYGDIWKNHALEAWTLVGPRKRK